MYLSTMDFLSKLSGPKFAELIELQTKAQKGDAAIRMLKWAADGSTIAKEALKKMGL